MQPILSRLLVRVAIVTASLAWAGFVFTQTVGDPDRGERIATAVLADDAARAEVVRPISAAVMRSGGLPPEVRPIVESEVDRALLDPRGARAFIDPFAGSWARLLGEDDPRPTEFDLTPLLGQLATVAPPELLSAGNRIPVPDVPLPRARLDWMDDVRAAVSVSILPLALLAAGLFAVAYAIGDRPRVLRRLGLWAIVAGGAWVVLPPIVVWVASRWAPGADAVVAVAADEGTAGLLPVALALVGGGLVAFAGSFAVRPERRRAWQSSPSRRAPARPARDARPAAPARAAGAVPHTRPVTATAEMPVVDRPTTPTRTVDPPTPSPPTSSPPTSRPEMPEEGDELWDYYTS